MSSESQSMRSLCATPEAARIIADLLARRTGVRQRVRRVRLSNGRIMWAISPAAAVPQTRAPDG